MLSTWPLQYKISLVFHPLRIYSKNTLVISSLFNLYIKKVEDAFKKLFKRKVMGGMRTHDTERISRHVSLSDVILFDGWKLRKTTELKLEMMNTGCIYYH